jgi:hypothetical protein
VKKRVSLGIRIDESLAKQLDSVAAESGIKSATLARLAIEEYLRNARHNGRVAIPISHEPANVVIGNTGSNIAVGTRGKFNQSISHGSPRRRS